MDGILEDPNPHDTAPIPAEFPGVEFDADLDEEVASPQEVAGDNAEASAASSNANILHGTSTATDDKKRVQRHQRGGYNSKRSNITYQCHCRELWGPQPIRSG